MNIFSHVAYDNAEALHNYLSTNHNIANSMVSISNDNQTPLMFATSLGKYNTIKLLLQFNADVHCRDINGNTVLYYAIEPDYARFNKDIISIIQLLLDAGANINSLNNRNHSLLDSTIHLWAPTVEGLIYLKYLIKSGANPFLIQTNWFVSEFTHLIMSEQIKVAITFASTYFRVIPRDICTMLQYYTN